MSWKRKTKIHTNTTQIQIIQSFFLYVSEFYDHKGEIKINGTVNITFLHNFKIIAVKTLLHVINEKKKLT